MISEFRKLLPPNVEHCRKRLDAVRAAMTEAWAASPCPIPYRAMSNGELLLYNMRHVQHHAAQLNMLLRERTNSAPDWVSQGSQKSVSAKAQVLLSAISDPARDKDFPTAMTTIASPCKWPSLTGCKASASRKADSRFHGETKRIACSSQVRTFGRALSFAGRAAAAIDGHDEGCTQPWTRLFNIRSKAPMDFDCLVSGRFFGSLRVHLHLSYSERQRELVRMPSSCVGRHFKTQTSTFALRTRQPGDFLRPGRSFPIPQNLLQCVHLWCARQTRARIRCGQPPNLPSRVSYPEDSGAVL
jgi:hypothetical protein